MKYLSLIIIIGFLAVTWWVSEQKRDLSVQQISKMNSLIQNYMVEAVRTNQPDVSDIDFSKINTEVIEKGRKMKAHFKFSYMQPTEDGEPTKVFRKGSFLITSLDGDKWRAQIEQVGDVQVEFFEPLTIKAGDRVEAVPNEETTGSESSSAGK